MKVNDDGPTTLIDLDDYEERVIDKENQEVRHDCSTCRPWFVKFEETGCEKC